MLSKELGETIFESRLIRMEEETLKGNFIKREVKTNEYNPEYPFGILRSITETSIVNFTNTVIQEGVSVSEFKTDEHGQIILEEEVIDCGVYGVPYSKITYTTTYDNDKIILKTKQLGDITERDSYRYDERGFVVSIISDSVVTTGRSQKNTGIIRTSTMSYDDDFNISNITVTEINTKTMNYITGVYTVEYNYEGFMTRIHLDGTDQRCDEYIRCDDDTLIVVKGTFDNNNILIGKTILEFAR